MAAQLKIAEEDRSPLSTAEKAKFRLVEARMGERRKAVTEFFDDLFIVHQERLYREKYETFEAYCMERWGLTRSTAYRQIERVKTERVLAAESTLPSPTNESQTRPLAGLPAEAKVRLYREAVEESGGQAPPASKVAEVVARTKAPRRLVVVSTVEEAQEAGVIPADVTVEVLEAPSKPEVPSEDATPLPDDEWLRTLPARKGLNEICRRQFDAEATAFRAITPYRLVFANSISGIKSAAKRRACHLGPYLGRIDRLFRTEGPERWVVCGECNGTGIRPIFGSGCDKCRGHGYTL